MAEIRKSGNRNLSRRDFMRAMVGLPLALGVMSVTPTEAQAASTKTWQVNYTRLIVPKLWKQKLRGVGMGHTSGVYNYHFRHKKTEIGVCMLVEVFDGPSNRVGEARGKTTRRRTESLGWNIQRGTVSSYFCAYNVPFEIWRRAHGEYGGALARKQATELLRISTGGKIKYSSLIRMSRKQAESKGKKAVREWMSKQIVRKIKIV